MMLRLCGAVALIAHGVYADPDYEKLWGSFRSAYGRSYTDSEAPLHFGIFRANVDIVLAHNALSLPYKLGINQFSDLTRDEVSKRYLGFKQPISDATSHMYMHIYNGEPLDDAIDWRDKGAVTPVQNQGSCGSCFAFSALGSLEGHWKISSGSLLDLSVQEIIDCDRAKDEGCHGGWPIDVYKYVQASGLCSSRSYPYIAKDGTCQNSCVDSIPKGAVTNSVQVAPKSDLALASALLKGPVSVGVHGSAPCFLSYHSGVVTGTCDAELNHGVLAVGYGVDPASKLQYWLIKNSWGSKWGEKGYIRLERNKPGWASGQCGILIAATFPVTGNVSSSVVV